MDPKFMQIGPKLPIGQGWASIKLRPKTGPNFNPNRPKVGPINDLLRPILGPLRPNFRPNIDPLRP